MPHPSLRYFVRLQQNVYQEVRQGPARIVVASPALPAQMAPNLQAKGHRPLKQCTREEQLLVPPYLQVHLLAAQFPRAPRSVLPVPSLPREPAAGTVWPLLPH